MKKTFKFVLPLVSAGLLAACGMSAAEHLSSAQTAYASNRYDEARIHLTNVLQEEPGNATAMELLVRSYLAMGDPVAAAGMLKRMEAAGKLPADHARLKAEAAVMTGDYDEAIETLGGADDAESLRLIALAHIGLKLPEKSAEYFEKGLTAKGNRGRLLADYAHLMLEQGDIARARELAAQAAALKPRTLGSFLISADIAVTEGKTAAALAGYEAALQRFPESRAALLGKIGVLGGLGKIDELRPLVAKALEESPQDTDLNYLKARIAAEDEKWDEVRGILQPFELQLDSLPLANALYCKSLIELGQVEQARMRLNAQILRDPNDRQARALLAEAKLVLGDAKGAVEVLRPIAANPNATAAELRLIDSAAKQAGMSPSQVLGDHAKSLVPRGIASSLAKGDAALRAGNWSAAIAAYESIRNATDGKNPLMLNNLAFAYSQAGNKAKALGLAEQALKQAPGNPSVMDTVGWLLHETGKDRARALGLLRKAAALAPGNATIRAHLVRAEKG